MAQKEKSQEKNATSWNFIGGERPKFPLIDLNLWVRFDEVNPGSLIVLALTEEIQLFQALLTMYWIYIPRYLN